MIKRLVLDVLFPIRGASIVALAESLQKADGVESVNITVKEVDVDTQNILIVIEGDSINYEQIRSIIEVEGGVINSVDQVVAGKRIIEPPIYFME